MGSDAVDSVANRMFSSLLANLWSVAHAIGLPVICSALASWVTHLITTRRSVRAVATRNDRRAIEINEDLRRWIADRDQAAEVRMAEVTQRAGRAGVTRGGALPQATGKVYRIVLREYRDAASSKQREFDALLDTEGRRHHRWRRRHQRLAPVLRVPAASQVVLDRWRGKAESDPSAHAIEPRLAELEHAA
jgi:hypothetical protein